MPVIPTLHLWPDDDPQQVRWWSPMATARVPVAALPAPARAGEPEGETCALGRLLPEAALQALGRQPTIIPGFVNGLAAFFLGRLLPRRAAVQFMGKTMRSMYRT